MISLISEPERIVNGETLKIKLNIEGKVNISTYKNSYFNLTIKKNGGTHGNVILYPNKFIGCPLEWEVNPYSYGSDGTFNVICTLQNSLNQICSTTFIVEPDCAVQKSQSCNNISGILHNINLRKCIGKKIEEEPEYFKSFQVQKQSTYPYLNICQKSEREKEIESKIKSDSEVNKSVLISSVKVQKAYKNV